MLADENKRSPEAVRYWFNVLDLEFSGVISLSTIYAFYASQVIDGQAFRLEITAGRVWDSFPSLFVVSTDVVCV